MNYIYIFLSEERVSSVVYGKNDSVLRGGSLTISIVQSFNTLSVEDEGCELPRMKI